LLTYPLFAYYKAVLKLESHFQLCASVCLQGDKVGERNYAASVQQIPCSQRDLGNTGLGRSLFYSLHCVSKHWTVTINM